MIIPTSPNDIPSEFHNSQTELRNCLMSLRHHEFVSIVWEMDVTETNSSGEASGEWKVEINSRRKEFRSSHENFANALWFATQLAERHNDEEFKKREAMRLGALAKLTEEEKRLLRI